MISGSDLSATASGLFFNFSGSGLALLQNPNVGSGINFICFAATTGCDGVGNGIRISTNTFGDGIPQTGLQQIGVATGGAIPEPASWAMLIAGFGLVGAAARRRATATVAA